MAWEIASSAAGLSPATLTEAHVDEARSFVEMKILPQLKLQLQEELDPPSFKRFSIPTPTPTPEKATTKQTETPKLKAEDPAKPRWSLSLKKSTTEQWDERQEIECAEQEEQEHAEREKRDWEREQQEHAECEHHDQEQEQQERAERTREEEEWADHEHRDREWEQQEWAEREYRDWEREQHERAEREHRDWKREDEEWARREHEEWVDKWAQQEETHADPEQKDDEEEKVHS